MFVVNYTIVDWGPLVCDMWLSNCSDDINSTMCDYVTQVARKITNSSMEHFHDKGLLGWVDGGMTPPRSLIILNKLIGPEQWDIWKLAASTEKLGTWTGYFTGTNRSHSNYSFHYNHSYFIQACVPLPFGIAIENLQFNKTLRSVTCIDCKLYTCLNFSISLKNKSLLILRSQHSIWLPVDLQ